MPNDSLRRAEAERLANADGGVQVPTATQTYNNGITPPNAGFPPRRDQAAQSAALSKAVDGKLTSGAFILTDVGLDMKPGEKPTKEDWLSVGTSLRLVSRAFKWLLADWLVKGEEYKWGEKYTEAADWSGYEEKTLREYAYVARKVDLSIRMDKLSFGHHQAVAAVPSDQQQAWLEKAAAEKWTVKKLVQEIAGVPVIVTPTDRDPYGVKGYGRQSRKIEKFVDEFGDTDILDPKEATRILEHVRANKAFLEQVDHWLVRSLTTTGNNAEV